MLSIFPSSAARSASLEAARVDLWTWELDASANELARTRAYLSAVELERAARFATDRLRCRWTMARGILRETLAGYLGLEPGALDFELNPQGKPSIAGKHHRDLHFSLSHSHGVAGLAVSQGMALGFDMEVVGSAPLDVAESVFSPAERAELDRHVGAERHAAFYRGWTRKEAFVKALGLGLSYPLERFDVSLSRTEPRVLRSDGMRVSDCQLVSVEHEGAWVGAVAAITPDRRLEIAIRSSRAARSNRD